MINKVYEILCDECNHLITVYGYVPTTTELKHRDKVYTYYDKIFCSANCKYSYLAKHKTNKDNNENL